MLRRAVSNKIVVGRRASLDDVVVIETTLGELNGMLVVPMQQLMQTMDGRADTHHRAALDLAWYLAQSLPPDQAVETEQLVERMRRQLPVERSSPSFAAQPPSPTVVPQKRGWLSRLLDGEQSRDILSVDVRFYPSKTVSVTWIHFQLTEAGATIDRLWLTAIYCGSVLTNLRASPDIQAAVMRQVDAAARVVVESTLGDPSRIAVPLDGYRLVPASTANPEKRYQSTLYRNSGNSFVNQNKQSWGQENVFAPLSVLSIIASNVHEMAPEDVWLMGVWLLMMGKYYRSMQPPSTLGSSAHATLFGYEAALAAKEEQWKSGTWQV